jgi:hypothetical protein
MKGRKPVSPNQQDILYALFHRRRLVERTKAMNAFQM